MCRGLILALWLGLAACSPALDWREARQPELGFTVALPGKPLVATREIPFDGATLPMTMVSAGHEGTLFAVGVARLPAAAMADVQQTTRRFAESLRRNVHGAEAPTGGLTAVPALTKGFAASRALRAETALSARGDAGSGGAPGAKARAVHLYARLVVVDDRLYQVVALGSAEQLTTQALDTFFQSFRLLPPS
jgi:hypothetical protein